MSDNDLIERAAQEISLPWLLPEYARKAVEKLAAAGFLSDPAEAGRLYELWVSARDEAALLRMQLERLQVEGCYPPPSSASVTSPTIRVTEGEFQEMTNDAPGRVLPGLRAMVEETRKDGETP